MNDDLHEAESVAIRLCAHRFDCKTRWSDYAVLYRNEVIEESGVAAAVLGNPAMGVAWLANKLSHHGDSLARGEIVLAGSFTRPIWVQRGDIILGDYRDLGAVSCRFA